MKRKILNLFLITILCCMFAGCSEASKVNQNLNKQADYFDCLRRITVYNARTDTVILEMEGYMSLSNTQYSELVVTCKTGTNEYKKNYIYLNDYTLYVVEDISGTNTDPYHYVMYFHNELPVTYSSEIKP